MSKWVGVPIVLYRTYAVEIEDDQTIEDAEAAVIENCLGENIEIASGTGSIMESSTLSARQIRALADEELSL